ICGLLMSRPPVWSLNAASNAICHFPTCAFIATASDCKCGVHALHIVVSVFQQLSGHTQCAHRGQRLKNCFASSTAAAYASSHALPRTSWLRLFIAAPTLCPLFKSQLAAFTREAPTPIG